LFCAGARWESVKTRLMIRQFPGLKVYRMTQRKGKTGRGANFINLCVKLT
jgi:hypothetical protein